MKVNGKKFKVGEKAIIAKDCRNIDNKADGQEAVFLGKCWLTTGKRYRGPREHFLRINPKFRLKDGSIIWGIECWWIPVSQVPESDKTIGASSNGKDRTL